MMFSEKDRERIAGRYDNARSRLDYIQKFSPNLGLTPGEDLHIWKRLETLMAMSREELMAEVEADYVIFTGLC